MSVGPEYTIWKGLMDALTTLYQDTLTAIGVTKDAADAAVTMAAASAASAQTNADAAIAAAGNATGTYVSDLIQYLYRNAGTGSPVSATWEDFGPVQNVTLPYASRIKVSGLLACDMVASSATSLVQVRVLIDGATPTPGAYLTWKRPPAMNTLGRASMSDYFADVTSAVLSAGAHTVQFQVYHGDGALFYYNTSGQAQGIHAALIETMAGQL